MSTGNVEVEPGDWYLNTENNERVAVVGIENWMDGDLVAILQYEDGVFWDESLVDGDMPSQYQPLPSNKGRAPTLSHACPDDQHVFDVEPQSGPHSNAVCEKCRLSIDLLTEYSVNEATIWKCAPNTCVLCDDTIEIGEDRRFIEGGFLCTTCTEEKWDEHANVAYSELGEYLLLCSNSPLTWSPSGDTSARSCGFWAQATPERTERYLPQSDSTAGCPECGQSVKLDHSAKKNTEDISAVLGFDLPQDAGVPELVEAIGEDTGVFTQEQVSGLLKREEYHWKGLERNRARRKRK